MADTVARPGRENPRTGRVFILRSGALGDFVLTLPVLSALRRSFPRAEVTIATRTAFGRLARASGLVDGIVSEDSGEVVRLYSDPAESRDDPRDVFGSFDLALSFVLSPQVRRNLLAAGAGVVWSRAPRPPRASRVHAADHLLAVMHGLGRSPGPATPHLALTEEHRAPAEVALRAHGVAPRSYAALHPGSGSPGKNWPLERFVELAHHVRERLSLKVVLLAGPAELEDGRRAEIEGAFRGVADAFLREPDLVTLAGVLAASAAYVGNDSGVTHLAAAVGTKVVAVFGPTDPAVWGPRCRATSEGPDAARPRGGGVRVVRHSSGKVEDVTADEVMDALRGLIG